MSSLGFSRLSMWQAPEVPRPALIPTYLDNTSKMFLWESLIFFWLMIQIASFVISPVWLSWYFIKLFHQHYLIRASKQSYGTRRLCSFYRQTRVGKGSNCGVKRVNSGGRVLPITGSVALGEWLNLSVPHVVHLKMEMKMDSLRESLKAVSGTIKCSTNFVIFCCGC